MLGRREETEVVRMSTHSERTAPLRILTSKMWAGKPGGSRMEPPNRNLNYVND